MLEQVFNYSTGNEKVEEKLVMDENVNYVHMMFNEGEGLSDTIGK